MSGFRKLRKVSIIGLIDMLKKIYDDGADFIDIEGEATDGSQDMIKITVKPEYYTDSEQGEEKEYDADPEYMVTEQDYEEEFPPISDEDINDLIK
jgi:hypothetical protein|tara:strand:- start:791 stop:1075 length:285 start_codon:yes stop_codon:yes gene_type:complete